MSASTRTTYRSSAGLIAVDSLTKQILTVANQLLALPKFGGEAEPMTATQGSYRPWTSYSGPTHRGCGAVDVTAWNAKNRVIVLDLLGMVPFHRTPSQGPWPEHIHCVTDGLGCVDPYAQGQIASAKDGHNGLRGNGSDPDARLRSHLWPLAVFQGRTGRLTASQHTHLYDGPGYTRARLTDVPEGGTAKALMEVSVDGNRWFVTDSGEWGRSSKWAKT